MTTSDDYVALLAKNNLSDLRNYSEAIEMLSRSNLKKQTKQSIFMQTTTIDLSQSNNHIIEMIGDCKLSFINAEDGETYKVIFKQKNQGRHEVTSWGHVKFSRIPDLSNSVNSVDILVLYCMEGILYGSLLNNFI